MGLDLIVEGRAKPGHEAEWRSILARSFNDNPEPSDEKRFEDISVPGYAGIGAPRVGEDPKADAWIASSRKAQTPDDVERVVEEYRGYYVLALIQCDGIPEYTHAGLYEGVDETSFRGSFLSDCDNVLESNLIHAAWEHRFPEQAINYGRELLEAAERAEVVGPIAKTSLLSRLGLSKPKASKLEFKEQLRITRTAGRWFIFWGERQHAIRAWC